jgi:aspartokinase-like uncharacterized kinase
MKLVVKVGGSLFDRPELGPRLVRWLKPLSSSRVLLVPGGGQAVDVIRNWDQRHGLGEESAHWLALRALSVNAHFLAAILRKEFRILGDFGNRARPIVIAELKEADEVWRESGLPILDAFQFAQEDEGRRGHLPHSWSVTSDSLAARVAVRLPAQRLILLKSASIPKDWIKAERGIVDPYFEEILHRTELAADRPLQVAAFNFREWPG